MDIGERQILLVFIDSDGPWMVVGTIKHLAETLKNTDYGYNDVGELKVCAPGIDGLPIPVTYTVDRPAFDANDFSLRTVTLTFPDGAQVSASYQIDGRS